MEEALQLEKPDLDMVAGQQGVSPIPRHSLWNTILTFFMQFLAPLVCGFMLALCLGTLVGILDLDDFSRRDSAPKFILAAALGFVIVYLMGELFSNTVHALTRALEMKAELDDDRQIAQDPMLMDRSFVGRIKEFGNFRRPATPRLRAGLGITLILILAALGLGCAEVIAEGSGIRELHHQQIARRMRFRNPNSGLPPEEELWWPMYMVIGTLISGPYLMYKASKSWGESDVQLREAWLLHQQQTWIDSRRAARRPASPSRPRPAWSTWKTRCTTSRSSSGRCGIAAPRCTTRSRTRRRRAGGKRPARRRSARRCGCRP